MDNPDLDLEQMFVKCLNLGKVLAMYSKPFELEEVRNSLEAMKLKNMAYLATLLKEQTDAIIRITEDLQRIYDQHRNLNTPVAKFSETVKSITLYANLLFAESNEVVVHYEDILHVKSYIEALFSFKETVSSTIQSLRAMETAEGEGLIEFERLERILMYYAFYATVTVQWREIRNTDGNDDNLPIPKLCQYFRSAYEARNGFFLSRVMRLFVDLKVPHVLLKLVREEIMEPALPRIFSEDRWASYNYDLDPVFADAMKFYQTKVHILVDIVRTEKLKNVNILLECFWAVIEKCIVRNIPAITSAGNADVFFANYKASEKFVLTLCQHNGIKKSLHGYFPFAAHMERYNTSVYYEIRHQSSSFRLEHALQNASNFATVRDPTTVLNEQDFKLKLIVSEVLCEEIEFLFSSKVFLTCLSHSFLKSAILFMGRYLMWVQDHAVQNEPTMLATTYKLVYFLKDMNLLEKVILFNGLISIDKEEVVVANNANVIDSETMKSVERLLRRKETLFSTSYKDVKGRLCKLIVENMVEGLAEVSSIPRFYRRTNRSEPTTASGYVLRALYCLEEFCTTFISVQQGYMEPNMAEVVMMIVVNVCDEYGTQIKAVLDSMHKTEESLRRLKSRTAAASRENLDDVKIKLQIKLDIELFVSEIKRISKVDVDCAVVSLMELANSCEH